MALSPQQRSALWDGPNPLQGLRTLSARPGTGKTTTVTQYCLDIAGNWLYEHAPWQGIAVLSYTNVAKDEVEAGLRRSATAHALLRHPHFIGTLDAFLNQYVFLPHGATAMGFSGGRPTLVGEPFHRWRASWPLHNSAPADAYKPMFFDCYTVGRNDQPIRIDSMPRTMGSGRPVPVQKVTPGNTSKITALKRYVWGRGMALQTDANYLALKVLYDQPGLAAALAQRFPVVVVDEAQDMTDVQHGILDTLIQAGLSHVVLVGDEHQAIYEWNTARPDLFIGRAQTPGWQSQTLAETYRCSPAISATLTAMAADNVTLVPAAKAATYNAQVQVAIFDSDEEAAAVASAIDSAAKLLSGQPHDGNAAGLKLLVVTSRSAEDVRRLHAQYAKAPVPSGDRIAWDSPITREFLRTIHHLERDEHYQAVHAYETAITRAGNHTSNAESRAALMLRHSLGLSDVGSYRILIFDDLEKLAAALSGKPVQVSDCAGLADLSLQALDSSARRAVRHDCARAAATANESPDRLVSSLFAGREERTWLTHPSHPDIRILFATVHAVKGETFDSVVLHTKHRVYPCGCPQSAGTWKAVLSHSMLTCETKRIAYVACSRAAQTLHILTPAESADAWQALASSKPKS